MSSSSKTTLHIISTLIIATQIAPQDVYGMSKHTKHTIASPQKYTAQTVAFGQNQFDLETEISNIFSIPETNAVGTIDINNSITMIEFMNNGRKLNFDQKLKDFFKYVSGGDLHFLPVLSKETIGYAQTRRFVFFDFTKKTHTEHVICDILEETISNVAVLDAKRRLFAFEVSSSTGKIPGISSPDKLLRIIDLSSNKKKIVSNMNLGESESEHTLWAVQNGTVFVYRNDVMSSFDSKLRPVDHLFSKVFNANSKQFSYIDNILIHPYLPLAVVVAYGVRDDVNYSLWIASWKSVADSIVIPVIKDNGMIFSNFSFSPDGKWVVFQKVVPDEISSFFIAPIDGGFPPFLGHETLLGKIRFPLSAAWVAEPLGYVATDGREMIKWDIETGPTKKN